MEAGNERTTKATALVVRPGSFAGSHGRAFSCGGPTRHRRRFRRSNTDATVPSRNTLPIQSTKPATTQTGNQRKNVQSEEARRFATPRGRNIMRSTNSQSTLLMRGGRIAPSYRPKARFQIRTLARGVSGREACSSSGITLAPGFFVRGGVG